MGPTTPNALESAATARSPDRGVARRQAFLDAARRVFLEQGYEAASVNEIVRRAGGSLATLYVQFASKEGLFLAVLQELHARLLASMTPDCIKHLNLHDGLTAIGMQFMQTILSRENLAFYRLVIGEARKFPDSAVRYMSAGADLVRGVVADHIRASVPSCEDPDMVASYFLELLRSRHHYRAMLDGAYILSEADLRAHVAGAVGFITKGLS